jgi:hypothetical protein
MPLKNKIVIFLILCIITHLILYVVFYRVAEKENPLLQQMAACKKNSKVIKILLIGDSHAERSINAPGLDSTFSLAFYGENNMFTYFKLKYCLENYQVRPKYVLLQCDLSTYTKGFNYFRTNNFFYYSLVGISDIREMRDEPVSEYYRYLKIKLFPYSDWQYALNLAGKNRQKKGEATFTERSTEEKTANARNFMQNELMCSDKRENLFFTTSINYLKKTIVLCKEYNIKPVVIKYPLMQQVFDVIKNEIDSTALQINNRPPEMLIRNLHIPVLDFEYFYAQRPDLFFDCHHLNNAGKLAFTRVFKHKLDSLLRSY